MDIRIECEELPEGGFRAYVYKNFHPLEDEKPYPYKGTEIYGDASHSFSMRGVSRMQFRMGIVMS